MDEYLQSNDIEQIDLIKIDIEGFEIDFIFGAMQTIKKYHPRLIVESHTSAIYHDLTEILAGLGYRKILEINKGSFGLFDQVQLTYFAYVTTKFFCEE